MKKIVITLLALLVCSILPLHAYEYFTIYFSDGSKSEAFYATDVDSICYSKVDLDSIEYADWQVQEIYTCDSIYRYPLAQIDSLSFKDVDVNRVAEDIANVIIKCEPLLGDVVDPEILESKLQAIRQFEEVDDAYINNRALFVDIRDWGCISFYFPLDEKGDNDNIISQVLAASRQSQYVGTHEQSNPISACIANQQAKDQNRLWFDEIANDVKSAFDSMGISCKKENMPKLSFFKEGIFNYDLVFIKTHGCYDTKYGLHWLLTGQELFSHTVDWPHSIYEKIYQFLRDHDISPYKMTISHNKEMRNDKTTHVYYIAISDIYIRSTKSHFKNTGSAIVFNTACESMKGNVVVKNNMAKAFLDRGAGAYLGYNDSNDIGAIGGSAFFFNLLNGMSVSQSYKTMPDSYKKEDIYLYRDTDGELKIDYEKRQGIYYVAEYHPVLQLETEKPELCITHPETLEAANYSNSNGIIKLKGKMKMFESLNISYSIDGYTYHIPFSTTPDHTYGFQLSITPDMSQAVDSIAEGIYDSSTLYMNWEKTIDVNTLQPNTTYYYRAYMNDGESNCYGEVKSFTTENVEAYAVLNDGTLTFYYDGKQKERVGGVFKISFFNNKYHYFEPWYDDVYIVDFDPSFYYYTPMRTYCWFNLFHNLTEVRNIKWLNTSKITEMGWMFANCNSLKALDLRSFDTSNVIGMKCMFENCSSLTYLDMSSFDTHNVTNMWGMFDGCCSLPTIDVSNFDTSNVIEMPALFKNCSSVRSLDLSHFKVSSDTNIQYMFQYCSSLTTIYAGNWNTGVWSNQMFEYCDNLVGGRGTKVGRNYYIDENGEQRYYDCSPNGSSAHIDGGKDNPGLFTAK